MKALLPLAAACVLLLPLASCETSDRHPTRPGDVMFIPNSVFTEYVEAIYLIHEAPYNPANEARHFEAALRKVVQQYREGFAPTANFQFVVVELKNIPDHKDESSAVNSYKAAKIFNWPQLFAPNADYARLISDAPTERHAHKFVPGASRSQLIAEHAQSQPRIPQSRPAE